MTHSSTSHFNQMIQQYLLGSQTAWRTSQYGWNNVAKTSFSSPSVQHHPTGLNNNNPIEFSQDDGMIGVILADQLTFKDHIAKTAWSCRFALHNIRKIRPFLTKHATQLLIQARVISRLDYCNALLAGIPTCAIRPLQMIQNAATHLVFNEPKRAHVTPLLISLHWLPVVARIKFKSLMLAYRTAMGSALSYAYTPPPPPEACGQLTSSGPWLFEWWLKPCITGNSHVYCQLILNRLMYSSVVSRFGLKHLPNE